MVRGSADETVSGIGVRDWPADDTVSGIGIRGWPADRHTVGLVHSHRHSVASPLTPCGVRFVSGYYTFWNKKDKIRLKDQVIE